MIEIAISLAVIGFALVAIIAILPAGMNVQKENREQTIINQDYSVLIDAIRSGSRGFDDLTNYVFAISNYVSEYNPQGKFINSWVNWHTRDVKSTLPITNGYNIIGLLSTPRFTADPLASGKGAGGYVSNYVVAFVHSMSGNAGEKFPQTNTNIQELSLNYRLVTEIMAHADYDRNWTNYTLLGINANEYAFRSNYWTFAANLQTNLHDVRLIFRWPLLPNGDAVGGRQSYRTMIGGRLLQTNLFNFPLYFFESRNYVKAGS